MAARARGEGKTPVRPIRVEGELWDAFGVASEVAGLDRSAALRAFMEWFAHRPGAKMPRRPTVDELRPDAGRNPGDDSPREN